MKIAAPENALTQYQLSQAIYTSDNLDTLKSYVQRAMEKGGTWWERPSRKELNARGVKPEDAAVYGSARPMDFAAMRGYNEGLQAGLKQATAEDLFAVEPFGQQTVLHLYLKERKTPPLGSDSTLQMMLEESYHAMKRGVETNLGLDVQKQYKQWLNKSDREGNTPLHYAIMNQNAEAAAQLIKYGAEPYQFNAIGKGNNILHTIATTTFDSDPARNEQKKVALFRLFKPNDKAWRVRNDQGQTPVSVLKEISPQVAADVLQRISPHFPEMLLWEAVEAGQIGVVKELLKAGADPNERGPNGLTALHLAAHYGESEMTKVLLDAGADPGIRTPQGETAAHLTAYSNALSPNQREQTIKTLSPYIQLYGNLDGQGRTVMDVLQTQDQELYTEMANSMANNQHARVYSIDSLQKAMVQYNGDANNNLGSTMGFGEAWRFQREDILDKNRQEASMGAIDRVVTSKNGNKVLEQIAEFQKSQPPKEAPIIESPNHIATAPKFAENSVNSIVAQVELRAARRSAEQQLNLKEKFDEGVWEKIQDPNQIRQSSKHVQIMPVVPKGMGMK